MDDSKTRPAEPPYTRGAHAEAIQHVERQLARLRDVHGGSERDAAVLLEVLLGLHDATAADVASRARERGQRALGRVTR